MIIIAFLILEYKMENSDELRVMIVVRLLATKSLSNGRGSPNVAKIVAIVKGMAARRTLE